MTTGATFSEVRLADEAGRIVVFGVNEMVLGQPKSKFSTNRMAPRLPVPLPSPELSHTSWQIDHEGKFWRQAHLH